MTKWKILLAKAFQDFALLIKGATKTIENETKEQTHPALRCRGDVVMTSFCVSHRRRRFVPNEAPNDVSMERRQDVLVVRLPNVFLKRCNNVSKGRNNDVPSTRLHNVSNKSQMKHPTTFQWYVTKTSQWNLSTTSH